jgi:hypothetical protein
MNIQSGTRGRKNRRTGFIAARVLDSPLAFALMVTVFAASIAWPKLQDTLGAVGGISAFRGVAMVTQTIDSVGSRR